LASALLDLGGNNLKRDISEKQPSLSLTARFSIRRAVFFIGLMLVFLSSCARQIRRPAPEIPEAKVPVIRVALDDNLTSGKLIFKGTFRLKSEEAAYLLDKSLGEFSIKYTGKQLIFRSKSRLFVFQNFQNVEFIPVEKGQFTWKKTVIPAN